MKLDYLGCGTVRVELKLRFTGYRLRFTVLGYGLKNTFASEVFKFLHQKSLLWCFQSTHVSCPKIAFEGTPSANYSVKIYYFERIRLLKTFLFENEQLNSLQNFHRNTAVKCIKNNSLVFLKSVRFAFFTTAVYGLRFGTTGFGPRSKNPTPQLIMYQIT